MAVNNFAPAEFGGYVLGVNGSGGGGGDDMFIVNDVYDPEAGTHTLDKTWQEIYNAAVVDKKLVMCPIVEDNSSESSVSINYRFGLLASLVENEDPEYPDNTYYEATFNVVGSYTALTKNGYPSYS